MKSKNCLDIVVLPEEIVEVEFSMGTHDGKKVLRVNVDGLTVLRIGRIITLNLIGPNGEVANG